MNDRIDPTDPGDASVPEFVDRAFNDFRRKVLKGPVEPADAALFRTIFAAGFLSGTTMACSLNAGLMRAAGRTLEDIHAAGADPDD